MSLDHQLLDEVYLRDPDAFTAIFEGNQKPLVVLLVDNLGRVTYANDATYDAIGVGATIPRLKVSLALTEHGFLATLVGTARASDAFETSIRGTLTVSGEQWMALAARVLRQNGPAVAFFAGRRPLSLKVAPIETQREYNRPEFEHPIGLHINVKAR